MAGLQKSNGGKELHRQGTAQARAMQVKLLRSGIAQKVCKLKPQSPVSELSSPNCTIHILHRTKDRPFAQALDNVCNPCHLGCNPLTFTGSLYSVVQQDQNSDLHHPEHASPQKSHSASTMTEDRGRCTLSSSARSECPTSRSKKTSSSRLPQPSFAMASRIPSMLGWLRNMPSSPSFFKYFFFKLTMDSLQRKS